jgi:hypothetical protein
LFVCVINTPPFNRSAALVEPSQFSFQIALLTLDSIGEKMRRLSEFPGSIHFYPIAMGVVNVNGSLQGFSSKRIEDTHVRYGE